MTFHVFLFLLSVCLLLSLALLWRLGWLPLQPSHSAVASRRSPIHRLLKPRTPLDCPCCRLGSTPSSAGGSVPAPVRPWPEVKSRRGAPKRIDTEGFACPNPHCPYFGITDAHIHALVGDGKHGHAEPIQTFRGPACHTTFTARRDTPLYRLKTPSHQIAVVLSAAFRRARPFRRRTDLRLPASDHHHLADSCWRARSDVARAHFPHPLAPASSVG
jgi:hypothetical protein